MLQAMEKKKMLTDDIVLVDGLIRTVDLEILITLDKRFENKESDIKSSISNVVLNYFNVDNIEFGQSFVPSEIEKEIFSNVDEVRLAEITNFTGKATLDINEILQLNNFTLTMNYV
jgi:hypothetical protein